MTTYDPAWDMPKNNWTQQGSFAEGEIPLVVEPDEAPLVCLPPINIHWLPLILGCLDQLRNPSTWIAADDDALYAVLNRANRLMQMIGERAPCFMYDLRFTSGCALQFTTDSGSTWTDVTGWDVNFPTCVQANSIITTPPPNVPGKPMDQLTCNIASYSVVEVVQVSIQKGIDNILASQNLLQYALEIISVIPGFTLATLFVEAAGALYGYFSSMTVTNFEDAMSDPLLWSEVRCAIYTAVFADGHLTVANFPSVLANISLISYVHANVITAIHDYVQALGFSGLNQLQQPASLSDVNDCTDCGGGGTWCYEWSFTAGPGPWTIASAGQGHWAAPGFQSDIVSGQDSLVIQLLTSPVAVTAMRIQWSALGTTGGSARQLHAFSGGVDQGPFNLNGAVQSSPIVESWTTLAATCDTFFARLNNGSPSGGTIIYGIQLKGPGVNPFGADNCSF